MEDLLKIFDVSIDRLTIVANITDKNLDKFRKLVELDGAIEVYDSISTRVNGKIFEDVYFELDIAKAKERNIRNFRMDFNPKNLMNYEITWFQKVLFPLFEEKGLSRLDIAFDCEIELDKFLYIEKNPKKRNIHTGRDGSVETIYLGVRGSDLVIRIYNKLAEIKSEIDKNEKRVFAISESRDLAENEVLQGKAEEYVNRNEYLKERIEGKEVWWRFEFELRKAAIKIDASLFDGLSIVQPRINMENVPKIQDRAMLEYLENHSEHWNKLSRPTKAKYKKMQEELGKDEDLTNLFIEKLEQKKDDLLAQVAGWLSVPKENLFVDSEINLRHVKDEVCI